MQGGDILRSMAIALRDTMSDSVGARTRPVSSDIPNAGGAARRKASVPERVTDR